MLPFLHDVCSKQSRGSSTGPEVRATVGRLVATEHLKCAVGSGNEIWSKETTNVSSCSFRLPIGEERLV